MAVGDHLVEIQKKDLSILKDLYAAKNGSKTSVASQLPIY